MAIAKIGRNDPCWCNSGKKYKKCHLNRDRQKKWNLWDAVEINKKEFRKKRCFAKGRHLGTCDGSIVKAHTVSRGPNLNKIARAGKVIQYSADINDLTKTGGKLTPKEIGTGVASVFHGFCQKHDRVLFSCIENEDFVGRPDQCLAVAYRTLSRELYGKDASSHLRETLREADKGKQFPERLVWQEILDNYNFGNEAARKELSSTHDKLAGALATDAADALCSLIIEFDGELPFMLAGAWSPITDLFGSQLQLGLTEELLDQVFLSSFAGTDASHLCISWVNVSGAPGQVIADQISRLPREKKADAYLQFAVKHIENVFFSPAWFEALDSEQRAQMDALAVSGIDRLGTIPDAPICLDLNYALPSEARTFCPEGQSDEFVGTTSELF